MQDYKERMAHAWKENSKEPKKWVSNQSLNAVQNAYDELIVTMGNGNVSWLHSEIRLKFGQSGYCPKRKFHTLADKA